MKKHRFCQRVGRLKDMHERSAISAVVIHGLNPIKAVSVQRPCMDIHIL